MAARQPHFSPKQVASALGVSESSVKRWCDAGKIRTSKTLGGHRKISLDALQQFLTENGQSLPNPEVLGLPAWPPAKPSIRGKDSEIHQLFRDALARGDENSCVELTKQHRKSEISPAEVLVDLLTDAMEGIGEAWKIDDLAIYQERRACEIGFRLISNCRTEMRPPPPTAPVAIGGSVVGDGYQMPSMLVELLLREAGWNATNVGNNLPADSFIKALSEYNPDLAWLSVSAVKEDGEFIAQQNKIASALGENVPLIVGGRALTDQLRPRLMYTAYCDNLFQLSGLAAAIRRNVAH